MGRTPCEKCYTNMHPKESLQLRNYTMSSFYTKGTHSEEYGNSESIIQSNRQKSLLLSRILFSLK